MTLLTGSQHSIHWFISLHQRVFTQAHSTPLPLPSHLFLFSHSSPLSVSTLLNTDTLMHPLPSLVPSPLWVANQYNVGLIKGAPKSNYRPKSCEVKKTRDKGQSDEGRVVQDLCAVNAAVHACAPLISNPYSILAQMSFLLFLLLRNSAPLRLSP